ncbi:MAG: hypothetical protein HY301_16550 [Verrucomicrobia bacterium]|nr:hypothetical protein [Verrucomicrobiota bacterium]
MKKLSLLLAGGVLGATLTALYFHRVANEGARQRAQELAAWQAEKARLEELLARPRPVASVSTAPPPRADNPAASRTAQEILAELRTLKISRASGVARSRRALKLLEELVDRGPAALPAIHGFLARFEDVDYELDAAPAGGDAKGKGKDKGKAKDHAALLPTDFIVPPSLRFGLFDVVRRIGGAGAEQVLAEVLGATGRGAEVYYLARVLEQLVPGKYRDEAVATARTFLLNPLPAAARGPLDQNDRNYLYAVLALFGDTSLAVLAQTQLIQPDGSLDANALRFLHDTMGTNALPALAQAMFDPRVTEPKEKEELFKEALSFTGADPRADELLARAVTAEDLPLKLREKSIRDLDKHGFESPEQLTPRDLLIIEARLRLLEALGPGLRDAQLQEAWLKTRTELTAYLADPARKANKKKN